MFFLSRPCRRAVRATRRGMRLGQCKVTAFRRTLPPGRARFLPRAVLKNALPAGESFVATVKGRAKTLSYNMCLLPHTNKCAYKKCKKNRRVRHHRNCVHTLHRCTPYSASVPFHFRFHIFHDAKGKRRLSFHIPFPFHRCQANLAILPDSASRYNLPCQPCFLSGFLQVKDSLFVLPAPLTLCRQQRHARCSTSLSAPA